MNQRIVYSPAFFLRPEALSPLCFETPYPKAWGDTEAMQVDTLHTRTLA